MRTIKLRGIRFVLIGIAGFMVTITALATEPISHIIKVNGADLEYVDWDGSGPSMVFLAGFSDTPYIYNDLAPEFKNRFHVYGLTRRGHGRSEKTPSGYKLDELVGDILAFLTKLDLKDVTLVGHSLGAVEAMRFTELYPGLVRQAVMLEIAWTYDGSSPPWEPIEGEILSLFMPPEQQFSSLDAYRKYAIFRHRFWSIAAEANLREQVEVSSDGTLTVLMPEKVGSQILADRDSWKLTKIEVPSLFIFADDLMADLLPGLPAQARDDNELVKRVATADIEINRCREDQINAIHSDSPNAEMVRLKHTPHRCFIEEKERVVAEMNRFLR